MLYHLDLLAGHWQSSKAATGAHDCFGADASGTLISSADKPARDTAFNDAFAASAIACDIKCAICRTNRLLTLMCC